MVDPYPDPEFIAEMIDDIRWWQTAHRQVLEYLWVLFAQQAVTPSGRQVSEIIEGQLQAMQAAWSAVAMNASEKTVCEVSARIAVVAADVKDLALGNGRRTRRHTTRRDTAK